MTLFRKHLADDNDLVRYWAAFGLRLLGSASAPAKAQLAQMTDHDASSHIQIMAAYAHAGLGGAEKGVARLATLLDAEGAVPLRLQALSTLTLFGESARAALQLASRRKLRALF